MLVSSCDANTILDLLERQAKERGDLPAYTFLGDDDGEQTLTFLELAQRAGAVGRRLGELEGVRRGDRVLLIFPPGLEFITAFFGCVYAGVLAVPATFPKPNRPASRLAAIAADCQARAVLTTEQSLASLHKHREAPDLAGLQWLAIDAIAAEQAGSWEPPSLEGDDLVFLQYTSGSTSAPRGVMVSHRNLLHNLETIRQGFAVPLPPPGQLAGTGVSWLPAYHDMGLIGGILESLYVGGRSVLFSPADFLRQPLRWLRTISRYGALISGAPNFAYELCVQKATPADVETLDLRSWRVAFCGAEPIQAETLDKFTETFSSCGFRADAFYCCYGLAEATLLVTGGRGPSGPIIRGFRRGALRQGLADPCTGSAAAEEQRLVGCGTNLRDQRIAIIDSATGRPVTEGRVGEIWVRGPHVSKGYWGCEAENGETFGARLPGEPEGGYLRTGDLGFFFGDQLFVTGRLRDLLIIRGRNHYPQDIEVTVSKAHATLISGGGAAFGVWQDGQERLVIVQEAERGTVTDAGVIFRAVRREVTAEHGVEVSAIALIRRGSLPRTTSGKVQRFLCRERYLAGALKTIAVWSRDDRPHVRRPDGTAVPDEVRSSEKAGIGTPGASIWGLPAVLPAHFEPGKDRLTELEISQLAKRLEAALLEWLASQGGTDLDPDRPFAEYGVDSLAAVQLVERIEATLRIPLAPVMAWDYPTPSAMAAYLARRAGDPDAEESEEVVFGDSLEVQNLLSAVEGMSDEEARAALES